MSSLEIQSHQEAFNLSPISNCSGLSSLVLKHHGDGFSRGGSIYNLLDLALLPSGLRELRTDHYSFDISRLQQFRSAGITGIHLRETKNKPEELHKLLQILPELEVNALSQAA